MGNITYDNAPSAPSKATQADNTLSVSAEAIAKVKALAMEALISIELESDVNIDGVGYSELEDLAVGILKALGERPEAFYAKAEMAADRERDPDFFLKNT